MSGRGAWRCWLGWGPYSLPRWMNGTRALFHRGRERGGMLCSTASRVWYFCWSRISGRAGRMKLHPTTRRDAACRVSGCGQTLMHDRFGKGTTSKAAEKTQISPRAGRARALSAAELSHLQSPRVDCRRTTRVCWQCRDGASPVSTDQSCFGERWASRANAETVAIPAEK